MVTVLTGEWLFVGSKMTDIHGNPLEDSMSLASGMIMYGVSGYMSVQLTIPDSQDSTSQYKMDTSYLAYYGKYDFNADSQCVVHHVMGSNRAELLGKSFVRRVKYHQHGGISLQNLEPEKIAIQRPIYRELFWQLLKEEKTQ